MEKIIKIEINTYCPYNSIYCCLSLSNFLGHLALLFLIIITLLVYGCYGCYYYCYKTCNYYYYYYCSYTEKSLKKKISLFTV